MTDAERDPFAAFDHPCKDTCSGWKQGFEKGCAHVRAEIPAIEARVRAEERAKIVARLKTVPKLHGFAIVEPLIQELESEFEKEKKG